MDKGATGVVFGIQKFSIHDGPGIRTVVFLKGCPLKCLWCHNPEGISKEIQVRKTTEMSNLPEELAQQLTAINRCRQSLEKSSALPAFRRAGFELVGNFVTVDELLKEIVKDQAFYRKSGGGLTVSGGEPMFQSTFLMELLQKAKEQGINTCLETSGYASEQAFQLIAPYVDLFLFDIKETDNEKSRQVIGVKNERIFASLQLLDKLKKNIVLRCPIIPTINDRTDHFAKIAELNERYPSVLGCEIMPYHNYGVSKAQKIDYPFIEEFTVPSKNEVTKWKEQLVKEGGKLVDWKTISLR